MRNIAFGYSTRCNIRCAHCVAADNRPAPQKMELARAKDIIREMAASGVTGISFTAGEPFLYFDDILELVDLCRGFGIYTRIVTNSFWATSPDRTGERLESLRQSGLCQLRLSSSRWHQQHVPLGNIANAARACEQTGMAYFISFVTDFSEEDDAHEQFFRDHGLKFFPEPLMYAGRAEPLNRNPLRTDYQDNRCAMNPYLAPDLNLYACCDAGSHFETTNFFLLGNLESHSIGQLLDGSERHPLYHCIRTMGITPIASFAGFKGRDIVTYRKCELCKILFDTPETLAMLQLATKESRLQRWVR